MKGKILTQGMGLISPSGISSRVERSNSGYSLTNSGVLLLTDDDNSVTNDQNNDMEDDPGVTGYNFFYFKAKYLDSFVFFVRFSTKRRYQVIGWLPFNLVFR